LPYIILVIQTDEILHFIGACCNCRDIVVQEYRKRNLKTTDFHGKERRGTQKTRSKAACERSVFSSWMRDRGALPPIKTIGDDKN
jgi:hypothetical protein